jgi:3D (Asp-Asp-Asp) domain-containing protein
LRRAAAPVLALPVLLSLSACAFFGPPPPAPPPAPPGVREQVVTATAYNSVVAQADDDPAVTAHGRTLRPGQRVVAVSRDLEAMGLREGVRLSIEGLDGEWVVGDRMASRWSERIDVYMGEDVDAARRFGKRRVRIRWSE